MKTSSSLSVSAKTVLGVFFLICGVGLLLTIALVNSFAAPTPSSGTVGPSPGGSSATWQQGGPTTPGGNVNTESTCVENVSCETFTLTVSGTQTNWAVH